MKKVFVTIGLILGLTTGIFASSYENATISPEARSIISSLQLSSDFTKVSTFDGVGYYALNYNDVSAEFEYLANTKLTDISYRDLYNYIKNGNHEGSMKRGTYIQFETKVSPYNQDKADCESFVKAVAPDYKHPIKRGGPLYPNSKVKAGTVIVSHSSTQPGNKHTGHIAILLAVKKDYIWVMDQNFYVYRGHFTDKTKKGGIIGIHKIMFKKKATKADGDAYYDNTNAYNYSIARSKK